MRTSVSVPRKSTLALAIAAVLAFAGIASASASAAIEWYPKTSDMMWKTSGLTLKKAGSPNINCGAATLIGDPKISPFYGATTTGGGVTNYGDLYNTVLNCENSTKLTICTCLNFGKKEATGIYSINLNSFWYPPYGSPYGQYVQEPTTGIFTNPSTKGKPSSLVFNEAVIGRTWEGSQPITMSGTFEVTTGSGWQLLMGGS